MGYGAQSDKAVNLSFTDLLIESQTYTVYLACRYTTKIESQFIKESFIQPTNGRLIYSIKISFNKNIGINDLLYILDKICFYLNVSTYSIKD